MSKNIFQFITPSQLTEKFRFSTRVLMSWAALGLVLGIISGIIMISTGTSHSVLNDFVGCLFAVPIVICLFGLVGLGIDSMGGRDAYYDGWYWYLFPVVTYLLVGFWIAWSIIGFSLALAGVRLPKIRPSVNQDERERIRHQKSKDIDEQKKREMEQRIEEEKEKAERENDEEKKQEILESISIRERILQKIKENPFASYEDYLTDEEIDELCYMLLEAI
jgi:hypothetical protein